MAKISRWGWVVVFMLGFAACFEPPEYPDEPVIKFDGLLFRDLPNPSDADSLVISLDFTDGDGDMGIDSDENGLPFNERFYFRFPDGSLLNYADKRTTPGYDTLPAFIKPFNCTNWEVVFNAQNVPQDTLYFQLNPNYNNIFVEFYIKTGSTFQRYDFNEIFTYPLCEVNGFNGRFPILSKDITRPGPLEGTIRYAMRSPGFSVIFGTRTLKLRIYVKDRKFNVSNVIETDEFTLQQIRR
jgi:hypothetical protein